MPPKKFATVSFAAKPMAMPAEPAAEQRGEMLYSQTESSRPIVPMMTISVQTFEETGAKLESQSPLLTASSEAG
ncbi:MAG: hypothetical protein U5K37_12175 [Natrialbaceae archaeon]|nr:hypothetical protein [Natrialbaceae archaeon]